MTTLAAPQTRSTTGPSLADAARHFIKPQGVTSTAWPSIGATCTRLGITFDRWQDDAGRAMLAKGPDGLYAADAVVLSIPRQVGKTYLVGAVAFAMCVTTPDTLVLWTAHRYPTAADTFNDLRAMAERPELAPHIKTITTGTGQQAIHFRNGSRIMFGARERGFGRGFKRVGLLVFDEAQILTSVAIDDMLPSTNRHPNPLVVYIGTPPKPGDPGDVFAGLRADALSGQSTSTLYVEFSADADADPDDRDQWRKANPSYPHHTPDRALERLRKNLSTESFLREALGVWDVTTDVAAIDVEAWLRLARPNAAQPDTATVVLDVSPDRAYGSLGVAGSGRKGRTLVIERTKPGTLWMVKALVKLRDKRDIRQVGLHPSSQAGALIPDLSAAGIEFTTLTTQHVGQACAGFIQAVTDRTVEHVGQDELNAAVANAKTRRSGEVELWDRRDYRVNISPLVAVSGALYLWNQDPDYDIDDSYL